MQRHNLPCFTGYAKHSRKATCQGSLCLAERSQGIKVDSLKRRVAAFIRRNIHNSLELRLLVALII
jgi:hypothetical protein